MRLYVFAALLALSAARSVPPTHLEGMVKRYQTIYPQVLHKTRPKRNAHSDRMDIRITSEAGETFTLQLTLNEDLISPNFESVYYAEDGQKIKIQVTNIYNKHGTYIFYVYIYSMYV
jgi:hypothetical protein